MTVKSLQRRRPHDGERERLVELIARRRFSRFWRRPTHVRGWIDLPLLRGVAPIGTIRSAPSFAARHVQRLCGLPAQRARLIAELAGFQMEGET